MQKLTSHIYIFITASIKAALLLGLCCLNTVKAQQYGFLNYTTDNGLAQSQVTGMCQDSYGYLWFATWGGASRFDGVEFKSYGTVNGLLNNQVHSLFKDSRGRIWFGMMGGYSVFEQNQFKSYSFKDNLSQSSILSIIEYPLNTIWVLFEDARLARIQDNKTQIFTLPDTSVYETRNMIVGENNTLMIATDNGIFGFNTNNLKYEKYPAYGSRNYSYITRNENFYALSTFGEGIFIYNKQKQVKHFTGEVGLVDDAVRHLFYDTDGNLWASSISGVSLIDKYYRITNFTTANGLVNNNVRFTSQDNEGNMWFGTDGKGILKFTGKSVLNYTRGDGLAGDLVMSILQAKDGAYWFATYGDGISTFKDGVFKNLDDRHGLVNNIVWSLAQTTDNRVWMGTSKGLSVYDGNEIKSYYEADGLLSNKVTSLYADAQGKLWIGTKNGLNCFYDNQFTAYSNNAGITGGNIRCIIPDGAGNLWLGGSSGLYKFDGKRAVLFRYNKESEDNTVVSLRFDEKGKLWVGTPQGLFYFDRGDFTPLQFNNDIMSGNINFLMDDKENLWFGTNNGIFELNLHAYYSKDTIIVKSFGRNEGLRGRETNMNAVYKDKFNNIWFGTDGGLVKIGRQRFAVDSRSVPYIHISDVKIFFERPKWNKLSKDPLNDFGFPASAQVKYNQNHFTFYFTGISLTQPQKLRYRFMLEGYDQTWLPITETRYVTYSALPPGSYRFKVMAQNANGLWSTTPAFFDFVIVAPFWQTWWFYSLCAFAFVLVIFGLWQMRLAQLKRKNQTMQLFYKSKLLSLEQQSLNASMNRHFIFNSLNSIQYYINKQDKLEANRYLTNFAKLIRKNLDSSISSDLIPLSEELDRIHLYLSLETMRFKDRFDYEIDIEKSLNPDTIFIPPMLFQPYIENSIWHGILAKEEKGNIEVKIYPNSDSKDLVVIDIRDDGIGLSTSLNSKTDTGSTHISRGIEITSGRLNLLKKMTDQNLEIIGPMDITDNTGKVTGTLVKLIISVKIPLINEKTGLKVYEN